MREATPLSRPRESGAVSATRADRRPIRSRNALWAQAAASYLARLGVSPNQISLASVLAAGVGAVSLGFFPQPWNAIGCVCGVQLRLLCNLLDGMVAVEHGKQSQLGAMYNELPDRVSDSVLFVALGYASGLPWLGWLAALLAALTAYIRLFGAALGFAQGFLRSHGQAAPHGFVNSWLPHLHRRAFCSSHQSQSANHGWTDRCGFFANLLDAHPNIGEQVKGAQLTCGSPAPLPWSCAAFAFPIPCIRPN